MTGLQAALLAGALVGLGLTLVIAELLPRPPALGDALERLGPAAALRGTGTGTLRERMGRWGARHAPGVPGITVSPADLALLGIDPQRFYGDKVLRGVAGLLLPPLLSTLWALAGVTPPVVVPFGGSLALGAVLFFSPDLDVRGRAGRARAEFARALGAYIDLVALERIGGAGAGQALDAAATVGDSWAFRRLREELDRAKLSGATPWQQLRELAGELRLPELADLADIIRLSGDEGAAVYETLRARARSLRSGLLLAEQARANAAAERLTFPVALLAFAFLAILLVAQGIRLAQAAGGGF